MLLWYIIHDRFKCLCDTLPLTFQLSKLSGIAITLNITILIAYRFIESYVVIRKIYKKILCINIFIYSTIHTICHIINTQDITIITNWTVTWIDNWISKWITGCILLVLLPIISKTIPMILSSIVLYHVYNIYSTLFSFILLSCVYIILFILLTYNIICYYKVNDVVYHDSNVEVILNNTNIIGQKIVLYSYYNRGILIDTVIPIRNIHGTSSIIIDSYITKLSFIRTMKIDKIYLDYRKYTYIIVINNITTLTRYIELFYNIIDSQYNGIVYIYISIGLNKLDFCKDLLIQLSRLYCVVIYDNIDEQRLVTFIDKVNIINPLPVKVLR